MSENPVSRRRFLGTGVAAGATAVNAALPGDADARKKKHTRRSTTGATRGPSTWRWAAGFAGLTAARQLVRAGQVGRACSRPATASAAACGTTTSAAARSPSAAAPSSGPPRTACSPWPSELGVETFPTYDEGTTSTSRRRPAARPSRHGADGHRAARPDDPPRPGQVVGSLDQMATAGAGRRALARREARPTRTRRRWTPGSGTTQHETASGAWPPTACRPIFGAEPRELSLLFMLFYIASSGNEHNPGHLRAQLQHRGRRADVPLRRRLAADRREIIHKRSASGSCWSTPVREITQHGTSACASTPTA